MVLKAIEFITEELNQYLKNIFNLTEDSAVASNLLGLDGNVEIPSENKVVATLVNVEQEYSTRSTGVSSIQPDYTMVMVPPISLNLYVLFSTFFGSTNYSEALKFLSYTILFFQKKSMFNNRNSPELDKNIEKLTMEIVNLDFRDLSSMWSILGSRYLPSVLYKIRMVTFDSRTIQSMEHTVKTVKHEAKATG